MTSCPAKRLQELILKDSSCKVADHRDVESHVNEGRWIQIKAIITRYRWDYSDHGKPFTSHIVKKEWMERSIVLLITFDPKIPDSIAEQELCL